MRRLDIIQLILIIGALLIAYKALVLTPQLIGYLISWVSEGMSGGFVLDQLVYSGIYFIVYFILAAIILNRSKSMAVYISNKFDIDPEVKLHQPKIDFLYALFLALGIYDLVQAIPVLLNSIWKVFSAQVGNRGMNVEEIVKPDFVLLGLQVLIPMLLVIYAKDLANYFSKKISNIDEVDEIEMKNQE